MTVTVELNLTPEEQTVLFVLGALGGPVTFVLLARQVGARTRADLPEILYLLRRTGLVAWRPGRSSRSLVRDHWIGGPIVLTPRGEAVAEQIDTRPGRELEPPEEHAP